MVPDSRASPGWLRGLLAAVFTLLAGGCAQHGPHEMFNAVMWQQTSAEYRAATRQSYTLASLRLREALDSPRWSAALEQRGDPSGLPPAVVLDLDETVIDNSRYEAAIVARLGEYSPESFARWCETGTPAAVPGAVEFIGEARRLGVTVIFYTARRESLRACTERNLADIGVGPLGEGTLFLRDAGNKTEVRARLATRFRILLLIGDNLEDFVTGSKAVPDARTAVAERHAGWFGKRWIVLPNPVYGHWEAAAYGFDYELPRDQKLRHKRAILEP